MDSIELINLGKSNIGKNQSSTSIKDNQSTQFTTALNAAKTKVTSKTEIINHSAERTLQQRATQQDDIQQKKLATQQRIKTQKKENNNKQNEISESNEAAQKSPKIPTSEKKQSTATSSTVKSMQEDEVTESSKSTHENKPATDNKDESNNSVLQEGNKSLLTHASLTNIATETQINILTALGDAKTLAGGKNEDALSGNLKANLEVTLKSGLIDKKNVASSLATADLSRKTQEQSVTHNNQKTDIFSDMKNINENESTSNLLALGHPKTNNMGIQQILSAVTASDLNSSVGVFAQTMQQTYATHASTTLVPTFSIPVTMGQDQWGSLVADKVIWLNDHNLQSAELTLTPPDLGTLQAKIIVEDGKMDLAFIAPSAEVRQALENNLSHLREALKDSNIDLANVSISDYNTSKENFANQAHAQDLRNSSAHADDDRNRVLMSTIQPASLSNKMIDYYT